MLVTAHWSATGPVRLKDYHIEFALTAPSDEKLIYPADMDKLRKRFTIWKNVEFGTKTSYGTWHLNSDPRDGSPNIEVAAMCMGGSDVKINGPWGQWPYTWQHAWMHAAIIARVCVLKNIDVFGSFEINVEPSVLQNGPICNVSSHGERAYQTVDDEDTVPKDGYFAYSGDGECRYDCAALDESLAKKLGDEDDAINEMHFSANWIRSQAHAFKEEGIKDFWGLDGPVTP